MGKSRSALGVLQITCERCTNEDDSYANEYKWL